MTEIGTIINDRYRLASEIGRGGMGVVYRGHDILLERDVAIKLLSGQELGTEGRTRLLREAKSTAQLNHPNIVSVYDAGEQGGTPYIVMEVVEGVTLHESQPSSIEKIIDIAQQVCVALDHAHTHGIIHRDLKPENVMLTSAGAAKLMDFGLARSVVSRLTEEGGITGTVFYLAPELALGQEVDDRADLYALGVMLYELTTGQLPFQADDPLAVVSQHIHAPPVPPQAINPQLSPALNELILSLMEKHPSQRPESAGKVADLLDIILNINRLEEDTAALVDVTLHAEEFSILDRIARGRIIGRERELTEARSLWDRAAAGEGQLLLISGEPGVGKTRLTREIVTQIEVSGGTSLASLEGECYAEGGSPYAPFAQIVRRSWKLGLFERLQVPNFILSDLINISPALRPQFPEVPPNPPLDPKEEQYRLFENVTGFFINLSQDTPLLLVLEDIHWGDSGTLALLRHLARRARRQRIMIIATYREVELDQHLPFQKVLLDLNRERLAIRMKLTRLDRQETGAMLAALFGDEITPEFLAGIYRETEGNPFFIEEVCKALVESGKLYYADGEWHRPSIEELEIPQSVRVAIQARIGNLQDDVQQIVTLCAVIGREFDFDTLEGASQCDEDSLINALETAERAQLIEEISGEGGGTFTFVHALIPSTLSESVSGLRRRKLHRAVAESIRVRKPDDFAALANHFIKGGDLVNGLEYSLRAAEKAKEVYSVEEATRYYEIASEISESLDRPEQLRAIYEEIGSLQSRSNDLRAVDAYLQALELALLPEKRAELKASIGAAYANNGDERGLPYLDEAIDELNPASQANALALAYSSIGRFHHYHGRHQKRSTSWSEH